MGIAWLSHAEAHVTRRGGGRGVEIDHGCVAAGWGGNPLVVVTISQPAGTSWFAHREHTTIIWSLSFVKMIWMPRFLSRFPGSTSRIELQAEQMILIPGGGRGGVGSEMIFITYLLCVNVLGWSDIIYII